MTGDPAEEHRRQEMRNLERAARHGELPDPVHVLRVHLADSPPRVRLYLLCRWSTAARLTSDAAELGAGAEVTDLGPDAMDAARSIGTEDLAPGKLLKVGLAKGYRWLDWYLPVPPEPVPGSPQARAQRNWPEAGYDERIAVRRDAAAAGSRIRVLHEG